MASLRAPARAVHALALPGGLQSPSPPRARPACTRCRRRTPPTIHRRRLRRTTAARSKYLSNNKLQNSRRARGPGYQAGAGPGPGSAAAWWRGSPGFLVRWVVCVVVPRNPPPVLCDCRCFRQERRAILPACDASQRCAAMHAVPSSHAAPQPAPIQHLPVRHSLRRASRATSDGQVIHRDRRVIHRNGTSQNDSRPPPRGSGLKAWPLVGRAAGPAVAGWGLHAAPAVAVDARPRRVPTAASIRWP